MKTGLSISNLKGMLVGGIRLAGPKSSGPKRLQGFEFIALLGLLSSLTALGLDAILPALPFIQVSLGVSETTDLQLVVTLFILGMVIGEPLFGPLCDAWGRKRAILVGLSIFCIGTLIAMTAQSMEQLLLGRVVQGIGVSGPKIGSRAMVRDQFEGNAMARVTSLIFMVLILTPMISPAIGQVLVSFSGWRSVFVLYLISCTAAGLWLILRQAETLPKEAHIPLNGPKLAINIGRILAHKRVLALSLAVGLIFGSQLLYVAVSQPLFANTYGRGEQFAFWFAVLAVAILIAVFINSRMVMRVGMSGMVSIALKGYVIASCIMLVACLLSNGVPPFWWFMVNFFAMFACAGLLFGNLGAMAMQSLGAVAGLGGAMVSSVSSLAAVGFAIPVGLMFEGNVTPIAGGFLLAGIAAGLLVQFANASAVLPVQPVGMVTPD